MAELAAFPLADLDTIAPPGAVPPNFTPDPYPNIFWRNNITGENAVWQILPSSGSAAPTVQGLVIATVPVNSGWEVAGLVDLDSNGNTDIVWRNEITGENGFWLMNGTSVLQTGLLPPVPVASGWDIAGVADFSNDGNDDIFWRNSTTGENAIWRLSGTSIAGVTNLPTIDPTLGWEVAGVGDFTGSLDPDILWRNRNSGENGIWVMNGTSISSVVSLPTIAPNSRWEIGGVSDFDLNGFDDIVWRNVGTGENAIWLISSGVSGISISAVVNLPSVPIDSGWEIVGVTPTIGIT